MSIEIRNYGHGGTAWGGCLIIDRQFFNLASGDYLWLEAHEVHGKPEMGPDGSFLTAMWVPDGNAGGDDAPKDLHGLVKWMQDYPLPKGCSRSSIENHAAKPGVRLRGAR
jgi:hypothetical protein